MMTTQEFLDLLRANPDSTINFVLPDGSHVPPHYHITEVGLATKTFIDCGGKNHEASACLLQLWIADDVDHRLIASKLLSIFDRSEGLISDLSTPIEFEHEAPVLTQLPVDEASVVDGTITLKLMYKHTDCLAKDTCMPDFSLPPLPGQNACAPGTGCC